MNIYSMLGKALTGYMGSGHLALLMVVVRSASSELGPTWLERTGIAAPGEGPTVQRELDKLYSGIVDAYMTHHPKRR